MKCTAESNHIQWWCEFCIINIIQCRAICFYFELPFRACWAEKLMQYKIEVWEKTDSKMVVEDQKYEKSAVG